jgi:hypothetical protein
VRSRREEGWPVERLRAALLSESERTFIRERTLCVLEHIGVSVPCA